MLRVGQTYGNIEVKAYIGSGGQGEVFRVVIEGHTMALKLFYETYSEAHDEERLRWLAGQKLSSLSTLLRAAPQRAERIGSRLGHVAEFVTGPSLDNQIEQARASSSLPWTLVQGLQIAVSIAQGVAICEERGIAIGDIAANNLTIVPKDDHFEVHLLDFDNFNAPGVPPPRMLGQQLYLSPELLSEATTQPTLASDRYSLGVLLHEVLLLSHPKAGRDGTPEEFRRAVAEGRWHQDPVYPRGARTPDGYPAEILSPALQQLFRRAQSADPQRRPTAKTWVHTLWNILDDDRGPGVYQCEPCGGCFVSDTSKECCPYCGASHAVLGFDVAGRIIPLNGAAQAIGRREIGASNHVSARHVVVRRIGPEYLVEDVSSSGTWKYRGGSWLRLPARVPVPVASGDRLRLGDVSVRVVVVRGPQPR